MNESKHKKKHKVAPSITYTPPTLKIWTKEQLCAMDCVASVYTKDIAGMSIPQLKDYIQKTCKNVKLNPQFVYSRHHIGNLVSHRAVNKEMKKVAMSSIPYVFNNGHPITEWESKTDSKNPIDRMQSCLFGAPIMIDDAKYLCLLTVKFNDITGKIFPYVINLEDKNGMKVSDDISVLDSSVVTTPLISDTYMETATSQDSRAPSNPSAKIKQNIEPTKDNNIKTENYTNMNKKQIRLTESDLKQIVSESVNKILSEAYGTTQKKDKGLNDRIDSYLQYDHTYDPKKNIVWDDRKLYGNGILRYTTTKSKNSSKPSVNNSTYSIVDDDIVPELDTLFKAKNSISTTINNACTKIGCNPDLFEGIMDSISEKINFIMSTLRKHSFMSRGQNPYYGNTKYDD